MGDGERETVGDRERESVGDGERETVGGGDRERETVTEVERSDMEFFILKWTMTQNQILTMSRMF